MSKRYYCTHFDSNYLGHAKNLLHSLNTHDSDFILFMFCFDQLSYELINQIENKSINPIFHEELENFFPDLKVAKKNRNFVEYFFTCSPATCNYVMANYKEVDLITYLDADLFFFDSPSKIFDELEEYSIGIISHRFNFFTKRNKIYGKFNVGWVSFRRDINGIKCLDDWMINCINWCYQKIEKTRFADQKYLDYWPEKYNGVKIIENVGANVAIWNVKNYKLSYEKEKIFVDSQPLIFYHFANLKQIDQDLFTTDLSRVFVSLNGILLNNIYKPYIELLIKNKLTSLKIIPKEDNHSEGIGAKFRMLTRKIRSKLFMDVFKNSN